MLAATARSRLRPIAQQPLTQPESESLLAHSARALEQQRPWKRATPDRVVQATSGRVVAMERKERHGGKVRRGDQFGRVAGAGAGGTDRDPHRAEHHGSARWNSG